MKFKKSRLYPICGILSYIGAIIWVYKHELSPAFSYMGLTDKPLSLSYLLFAGMLAILPLSWLPDGITKPSQIILWVLYLLVVVPSSVIPYFVVDMATSSILVWVAAVTSTFWLIFRCSDLSTIKAHSLRLSSKVFWSAIFCFSAIAYMVVISVFGLRFNFVALADIYSVRDAYKEEIAEGGRLVSYMLIWQANVANPLFISQGLIRRNPLLVILGVSGQIFLYSISGFKSILFSTPLLLIALVALQYNRKRAGLFLVWGAVLLIGACVLLDRASNSILFSSIFVRRLMIVPGHLSAYYYEFFSDNPLYLLQHSVLRPFIDRSYDLSPAMLIGDVYFGNVKMSANANLWADAFANFGFVGMVAYAILFGFVLQFLDKVSEKQDLRSSCLLVIMPTISLCNSPLLTTLMTHGLGFAILLVYLLPTPQASVEPASLGNKKHRFAFKRAKSVLPLAMK